MHMLKRIKLFFISKPYRKCLKESLIFSLLTLKPVMRIASLILAIRFKKESNGLSQWEKYTKMKEMENEFDFVTDIYVLYYIMLSRDLGNDGKEQFEEKKNTILNNSNINLPQYSEFKEWLENASYESDISYIENFYNELMTR